jgi:hypothetical protein
MELVVTSTKTCKYVSMAREAYEENLLMYGNNEPCWLRCIHILLKHLNMDHMLTHPENYMELVVTSTKACKNVSMAKIF